MTDQGGAGGSLPRDTGPAVVTLPSFAKLATALPDGLMDAELIAAADVMVAYWWGRGATIDIGYDVGTETAEVTARWPGGYQIDIQVTRHG